MKNLIAVVTVLLISTIGMSQKYTFGKYYQKTETGQAVLIDEHKRTIEFQEDRVTVNNLFGCEYTSEYSIVEKISDTKYIIAYEGKEIVLVISPKEGFLAVTSGVGVKGQRITHLYANY